MNILRELNDIYKALKKYGEEKAYSVTYDSGKLTFSFHFSYKQDASKPISYLKDKAYDLGAGIEVNSNALHPWITIYGAVELDKNFQLDKWISARSISMADPPLYVWRRPVSTFDELPAEPAWSAKWK